MSNSTPPPPPDTTNLTKVLYLFGHPISHSLSPLFHNTIYTHLSLPYAQHLYETPSLNSCLALTKSPKFLGASVTMPFKVAIIPHLTSLTPSAKAIGAVNTIWRTADGDLKGTNTDCIGIREAISRNVSVRELENMKGRPGMVIGGGGTCRAAVYALKTFLGCTTIYLVNRDEKEVEAVIAECHAAGFGNGLRFVSSVEEARDLEGPVVAVSAVPDFEPKTSEEVKAREIIGVLLKKGKGTLLEMCYHPSPRTGIERLAKRCGWDVIEGTEAMIWQGFEQDRVWLGMEIEELPVEKVKKVISAKLARSRL